MSRPSLLLMFALSLAVTWLADGPAALAQNPAGEPSSPSSSKNPATPPASQENPPDSASETPQSAGTKHAKPGVTPKRVFTNDDLQGKGSILFPTQGTIGIDLNDVNDCDRACFEQIRQAARISAGASSQWKRELLSGIEKLKIDSQWQSALVDLARLKGRYCQLGRDKNSDLARHADPKNVTESEISIDDEYQRKFDALRDETTAAYTRASIIAQKFPGLTTQFAALQEQRIMAASCYPVRTPYYQPVEPTDDPDEDQ